MDANSTPSSTFWRWTQRAGFVCLLLAAAGVVGWLYVRSQIGEQARLALLEKLAKQYPHLIVDIDSAIWHEGRGVQVFGLSIREPRGQQPLVRIDEIFATCHDSLQELCTSDPNIEQTTLRGVTINITRQADGRIPIADLFPLKSANQQPPNVKLENGKVVWLDKTVNPPVQTTLRDISGTLHPDNHASGASQGKFLRFAASGDHANLGTVTLGGLINDTEDDSSIQQLDVVAQRITADSELWKLIPPELHGKCKKADGFQGTLNLTASVRRAPADSYAVSPADYASEPVHTHTHQSSTSLSSKEETFDLKDYQFTATCKINGGSYKSEDLPLSLNNIVATLVVNNSGVQLQQGTLNMGTAKIKVTGGQQGFTASSPKWLDTTATGMTIGPEFISLLPDAIQCAFIEHSIGGVMDAKARLVFDGEEWQPTIDATCVDVNFAYDLFPYPITGVTGSVTYADHQMTCSLIGRAAGMPINIDGAITNPGPDVVGYVTLKADQPIPFHEELWAAIDPAPREFFRSLHPQGSITFHGTFGRKDSQDEMEKSLTMQIHAGELNYEKFPYAITDISGNVSWDGFTWRFWNWQGRNGGGTIKADGVWGDNEQHRGQLAMTLWCKNVPLDDELRAALSSEMQSVWTSLSPRGTIDEIRAELGYLTPAPGKPDGEFNIAVDLRKFPDYQGEPRPTLSITPKEHPYRLENLTGLVRFRDGYVQLIGMQASHNRAILNFEGDFQKLETEGDWQFALRKVTADQLLVDHDLLQAMPDDLARAIAKLRIEGPLSLTGSFAVVKKDNHSNRYWDMNLVMIDGRMRAGVDIEHVHGGAQLRGVSVDGVARSVGEFSVDSMMIHGLQLTNLQGPIRLEPDRVLLGTLAKLPESPEAPRPILANTCDGRVSFNGQVFTSGDEPFEFEFAMENAKLQSLMADALGRQREISGLTYGQLRLTGNARGSHTWRGEGSVRLRKANIYELPVMLALLKILSIQEPDTTAFTTSDIDFRLSGETIYLDKVDLNGDVFSLKGNGELNFQSQVNLNFYTEVGSKGFQIPIVQPVLGAASREILVVQVGGTLDQPTVTRQAFPGINATLQKIFPELNNANQAKAVGNPTGNSLTQPGQSGNQPARPLPAVDNTIPKPAWPWSRRTNDVDGANHRW